MAFPLRTVFFGTPSFSLPSLSQLTEDPRFEVVGVVSRVEQPVGREQTVTASPVSLFAREHGISLFCPEKLRDPTFSQWLKERDPHICIVVAYGKIIPSDMLVLPPHGFINIHGSLLPRYRGASPIQYALLEGEKQTGITIMVMNEKMDEGDILMQKVEKIRNDDTYETLSQRLSFLGAAHLPDTVVRYVSRKIIPTPQNHAQATYTKIITKEMGKIDWHQESARSIVNKLKAFTPWPGIYAMFLGRRFKILEAIMIDTVEPAGNIGQHIAGKGIQTKDGMLVPVMVQPEGKRPMSYTDFLHGVKRKTILFE